MIKKYISIGAFLMALSIILGAFAAHGLEKDYSEKLVQTFKTGAEYQLYHSFGIILLGLLGTFLDSKKLNLIFIFFLFGIFIFSGSLYAYVLSGNKVFAMITPIGGLSFVLGWILLGWFSWRKQEMK